MTLTCGILPAVEDPDEADLLRTLKAVLTTDLDEDYLILQASEEPCRYLQARRDWTDSFLVEYRDGAAGRHFRYNTASPALTQSLFLSYLRGDDQWRTAVLWRDISDAFEDLRSERAKEFRESMPEQAFRRDPLPPEWYRDMVNREAFDPE
ncbi:MAG: hypothetical protein ACK47B_13240 [Armatimonadota bacterium]